MNIKFIIGGSITLLLIVAGLILDKKSETERALSAKAAINKSLSAQEEKNMVPLLPREEALKRVRKYVEKDIPDASDAIKNITFKIRARIDLTPDDFKDVDPKELTVIRQFSMKVGKGKLRKVGLLTLAVYEYNVQAARAMLDAGADLEANDNLFVTKAIEHCGNCDYIISTFLDYEIGIPFVQLFLEYGGNPNAFYERSAAPLLHVAALYSNLHAAYLLMEHGADPWQYRGSRSLAFNWLNGGSIESETWANQIIKSGYLNKGKKEEIGKTIDQLIKDIHTLRLRTDEGIKISLWATEQNLFEFIKQTNFPIDPDVYAEIYNKRIPDDAYEFYVKDGEYQLREELPGNYSDEDVNKYYIRSLLVDHDITRYPLIVTKEQFYGFYK